MKTYKTPVAQRGTYKHIDEEGKVAATYEPGKDGVTEDMVQELHRMDDHEVYVNRKENCHPEWFRPICDEWREKYVRDFKEKYGYNPEPSEIPFQFRMSISIDAEMMEEGYSALEEEMAVDGPDGDGGVVGYVRGLVEGMPKMDQRVYRLIFVLGMSKVEAGKELGVSDVYVGKVVRKIIGLLEQDNGFNRFFR